MPLQVRRVLFLLLSLVLTAKTTLSATTTSNSTSVPTDLTTEPNPNTTSGADISDGSESSSDEESAATTLYIITLCLVLLALLINIPSATKECVENCSQRKCFNICFKSANVALSLISSLALSNVFDFEPKLNGAVAMFCSGLCLFSACLRMQDLRSESTKNKDNWHQNAILFATIFASYSDGMFDFLQGAALYEGDTFADETFTALLVGTITGVILVSIDLCLEIMMSVGDTMIDVIDKSKGLVLCVCGTVIIGGYIQIIISFVLAASYSNVGSQVVVFCLQGVFALLGCCPFFFAALFYA